MEKEPEVHLGYALLMVGVEGAKRKAATKEQRARPSSVRPMEGGGAVSTLDAPRVPKAVLITA